MSALSLWYYDKGMLERYLVRNLKVKFQNCWLWQVVDINYLPRFVPENSTRNSGAPSV